MRTATLPAPLALVLSALALSAPGASAKAPRSQVEVQQAWLHAAVARELAEELKAEARVFDLQRPFDDVTVTLPEKGAAQVRFQLDDQASQHWQGRSVSHRREVFAALVEHTKAVMDFKAVATLAPRQTHVKRWVERHGLEVFLVPAHPRLPSLWADLAIAQDDAARDVVLARHANGRSELGVAAGPGDIDAIWRELTELAADRAARMACKPERAAELLTFARRYARWVDFALAQRTQPHHRPCGRPAAQASAGEQTACGTLRDVLRDCADKPAGPTAELAVAILLRVGTLPTVRGYEDAPKSADPATVEPDGGEVADAPTGTEPAGPGAAGPDPAVSFYKDQATPK
ncbi:MAG: hypothetical protein H6702_16275 [Myxococcales bacterium]|nr:hypothetical protein [Myxococcales bacterium]